MSNSNAKNRIYGVPDDEMPELTPELAKKLRPLNDILAERGLPPVGRPKSANPKVSVSLRLDREVVEGFKAEGPGWQTRMNAALAESLKAKRKRA
ncbi:hypothetical protein GCM10010862_15970 [Devosia nitrariae]|uniref:BrnA antitoxin of type II toxin-antitoxin system n=2 Tax=Devosia nitrariae TaxID=2071872 RepID=A0ABQ5W3M9_9HYPH|nr:hypothetical protein GCM10010862_15970 [Devosia nitrariae]